MKTRHAKAVLLLFIISTFFIHSQVCAQPLFSSKSSVKLRPHIHLEEICPGQPFTLDGIKPFLRDSLILQKDDLFATAPYVISIQNEQSTGGKGDRIFACRINSLTEQLYTIYKPNRFYVHPITKECLGYEAEVIGSAKMNVIDCISELQILTANEGVEIKAKLLPSFYQPPYPNFTIQNAATHALGFVLSVKEAHDYLGRNNVVVISLGQREGLSEGDLLDIYQTSTGWSFCSACAIRLPEHKIGKALVFRVFDKLSLALIVEASEIITVMDKVRSPSS